ncbi:MAG: hypothetical protein BMS9Abin07_0305 [Acidimicrobiia bacterium]|nr:MAG: hypothetical protein BMS9Abin07_0305 [Acidimicrobiia bacterium]
MDGIGEPAARPPSPESSSDRLNVALLSLGALIVILLIAVLIVLVTRDSGNESAADTSSTEVPPTSTSEPVTTSSMESTTTTAAPTTTAAAPTSTTAAPTATTAAPSPGEVSLPAFVTNDCIGYDPMALEIEDLGALGWRLNAGSSQLLLYNDEADALRGLAVAGNYTELCFIGRGNTRPDRMEYIREFWNGDSGIAVPIPGPENCLDYDPAALFVEDMGALGWRLSAGSVPLVGYDNEADALRGQALAANYTQRCLIGIGNLRADRFRYLHEYWK